MPIHNFLAHPHCSTFKQLPLSKACCHSQPQMHSVIHALKNARLPENSPSCAEELNPLNSKDDCSNSQDEERPVRSRGTPCA